MNTFTKCVIGLIGCAFSLASCVPIFNLMGIKEPLCASFNPTTLQVQLACHDYKVQVARLYIPDRKDSTFSFFKKFENPVNNFSLPIPDDPLIKSQKITIELWIRDGMIPHYYIDVTPQDWKSGNIVYGYFNYR